MTSTVMADRLREIVNLLAPGTGVDCEFQGEFTPSTYTVRGEVYLDQRGPQDVLCVGNDSIAYAFDAQWTPDTQLRSIRLADDVDDERWNRTVGDVAEAIEGVERLDFAQYPTGSVTLVELERVRGAIAELYRGERP